MEICARGPHQWVLDDNNTKNHHIIGICTSLKHLHKVINDLVANTDSHGTNCGSVRTKEILPSLPTLVCFWPRCHVE